jgi:hypothetical protein
MSDDALFEREAKRLSLSVTELKMRLAVPDEVIRDIANDARRGLSQSQSLIAPERSKRSEPQRRGTGWSEPKPLTQPPGIALIDAMCEAQDAKDRAKR